MAANQNRTPEMERKKRRRELGVAFGGALVIFLVFLLEHRIASSTESIPLAGHLLLFGLISIATLLLILVIFFLIRNIFKLVFERRQKVLGSHLKTRLTLAFVALTLVPTVVLFIASAGALHTTIESWFKTQVEDALQSSLVVAQAYYQDASDNTLNLAERTAGLIHAQRLLRPDKREELKKELERLRSSEDLRSFRIERRDGSDPLEVMAPALLSLNVPEPRRSFLRIGFQGESTAKVVPLDEGAEIVRAIVPLMNGDDKNPVAVLLVDRYIPRSLATRLFGISNAYGEYQEARRARGPIKTIYVLILLMVALLVIFIGSWFGMTMARDITDPIQRLADGADRLAAGDLDVYVEPVADDEIGMLVRSFNKMTADLRTARDDLVRVNLDLDSRRKYIETVLKNVAAGVLALDPEGRITACNSSARELLGAAKRDLISMTPEQAFPGASFGAIADILENLSMSNSDAIERHIGISLPYRSLTLICHANSLKDDEGRILGVVLVFDDLTHLVKAQRMAAWRDVAKRIAHEIKNPLTPIQLNAQRVRRKYMDRLAPDNSVLDQCTRGIIDQVEQLKGMVNEFSNFARMPSANPRPNDLNAVIREVVDLYAQANVKKRFAFRPDEALPNFDIDAEQIKRALVNLIDNAVAAVKEDGTVQVSTSFDPLLSMAVVEVADNGTGVPPADKDRLFEPYFTRKPGGTGLGLTIVNTIVADHGGFIRIKDNEGGGTKFVIELPVRKGSSVSQPLGTTGA